MKNHQFNLKTALFLFIIFTNLIWSDDRNQWERVAVILTSEFGLSNLDKPLEYSEKDGQEVADVLQSAGQLKAENIYRIHENDPQIFKEKIINIKNAIENKHQKIFLQVYYSGHGSANHLHIGNSKIPFEFIKANLGKNIADARMYVLDVCYGASFFNSKGFKKLKPIELGFDLGEWTNGEVLISSSAQNEQSFETKKLEGSIFTSNWLMALRGAGDLNKDGLVSLFEAYNYTYDQTVRYSTESLQIPQHPSYSMDINSGKDLILSRPLKSNSSLILKRLKPGIYSINDLSRNVPLGEIRLTEKADYNIALAPGKYSLNRFNSNDIKETQTFSLSTTPITLEDQNFKLVKSNYLVSKGGSQNKNDSSKNSFFISYGYGISRAHHQKALEPFTINRENEDYFLLERNLSSINENDSWHIATGLIFQNKSKLSINIDYTSRTLNTIGQGRENLWGIKKNIPLYLEGQGTLSQTYLTFAYEYPFLNTSWGTLYLAVGLGPTFYKYDENYEINRPLINEIRSLSSNENLNSWHFKSDFIVEYPIINYEGFILDIVLNSGIIFDRLKAGKWNNSNAEISPWKETLDINYINQIQIRLEW